MQRRFVFTLFLSAALVSCGPQLRLRNQNGQSLEDLGWRKYEVTVGTSQPYDILKLKNGGATLYKALTPDGERWANTYSVLGTTNADGSNATVIATGTILSEANRSLFQANNRYVWDIGTNLSNAVTLD